MALAIAFIMLFAAWSYFGLAYEFYRDAERVPFWFTYGMVALTVWGGAACFLTAACYIYPVYNWLLIVYLTNSVITFVFYRRYRKRNFEVRIKFDDESLEDFFKRVKKYYQPRTPK